MKKFIQLILFPHRLKLFYKVHALYHFFKIKYPHFRTKDEYKWAKNFIEYRQAQTVAEWSLIKETMKKNTDTDSQAFMEKHEDRIEYMFSNNLMDQNQLFNKAEQEEQKNCSQKLKKISKKLKKYNFSSVLAETFYSYNGLKYLPKEQQEKVKTGICIDGGAFEGDTAIMLINNFQANEVHSFEIEPNNYKKLLKTIKLSKSDKIRARLIGLSDHVSSGYVMGSGGSSSLIEDTNKNDVIIEKLDNLYSPIEKITFIKLDTEGEEQSILRGAEAIIKRDKPILAISIYHSVNDFFKVKPLIESIQPGYKFIIKKISPFAVLDEVMLIAYYE
ncbi:MAG: FkbM family methyltransferase [Clostridia bacterium]|nr:FkbM family methyltransferase [Clostridia bacterium]